VPYSYAICTYNLNNALVCKTYYFAKLLIKIVARESMIAKL